MTQPMTQLKSSPTRIRLFGMDIDALKMPEVVDRILGWIDAKEERCRYVVTPNVDHAIMFQHDATLRAAYADAGLILADGMPVVAASRLLGRALPGRVTGADLVPALFAAATEDRPLRVFLLGAGPGVADRAASKIETEWPSVRVVGTNCPPLGFEHDADQNAAILEAIRDASPDVVVVGLGAPKQELWVHRHVDQIDAAVSLCVGATIDFLAEEIPRAPVWMRKTGLEWAFRCASEPKRLARRYARGAWIFPQLVWQEWRASGVRQKASVVTGP